MIRLLKKLTATDWLILCFLVGVVVAQVYFDVTLPDYTLEIGIKMQAGESTGSILSTGGMMILYATGSMACSIIVGYLASYLASKLSKRLRGDIFSKVLSFSMEETNRFSTPSLITRSTNDIQQVQMTVMLFLRMAIAAPITAVWAIIKINTSNGELTLVSGLWIAGLIIFLVALFLIVLPKFKRIQKLTDKLNGVTRENLTGLRVVKAYNADVYQENKFEKANKDISKTNLFINRMMGLMLPIFLLVMNGISLTIYWFGASLVNKGSLDYWTMQKFIQLVMQVLMAFMMLTMMFIIVPRAAVSAKRINEVLNTKPTVKDPANGIEFSQKSIVEFKNVSFKYPGAEGYVLKNISFSANAGETVAIIGSTGSGKSTLINLVPRFYDATEGEVLINGVNVKDVNQKELRGKIGYVPQKGMLFSGDIKSNIAYGNENLSEEKMVAAAETAMAANFINRKEEKYLSPIAQGGKNISGGQRQRLSIARAIAIDPEFLIFDDSFSALDYKTDRGVRKNLKKHAKNVTNLIVAQRIGTIMDADKIIVLERGNMVGYGTHKELLETCDVYREIALSQLSKEELGI
ncbi:atp-binding cassette sub-family b [Holotrichia oblita]|nr:atp-binding cassette sub-family b [Holotrichia oblita]